MGWRAGAICDPFAGSRDGAADIPLDRGRKAEPRGGLSASWGGGGRDPIGQNPLGPERGVGDGSKSRLQGQSGLWQDPGEVS